MTTLLTRKLSDRYEDLGPLGKGGMGEVRRVFDQLLGRTVAMKLVHSHLTDKELIARFIEEAQLSARLQHPNIIPIHDLGVLPSGRYFFTMKVADGENLRHRIKALHQQSDERSWVTEGRPYSLRRLLSALRQVCDAIAYAHQRGVIHRDIKPQNIIIGHHGEVQLLDWGVARRLEAFYSEWVNEVVGQLQVTVTPAEYILSKKSDSLAQSDFSSDSEDDDPSIKSSEDFSSSQLSLMNTIGIEDLPQEGLYNLRVSDSFQDSLSRSNPSERRTEKESKSLIHIQAGGLNQNHSQASSFSFIDETPHHDVQHMKLSAQQETLNRFSVSSESLLSMNLSQITQRTSHGAVAGTIDYMSPEQLKGDINATSYEADVYGLGVVLYELLTCQLPFPLPNEARHWNLREKLRAALDIRERPLQWPVGGRPIPEDLKNLCEKALHPDKNLRLKSAHDFSRLLVDYLDGVGRRERGLEKVKEAEHFVVQAKLLNEQAQTLFDRGEALNGKVKSSDSEQMKRPAWALLDEANDLRNQARDLEYEAERALYDALLFDDQLTEAHTMLALRALESHRKESELHGEEGKGRLLLSIQRHFPFISAQQKPTFEAYLSPKAPVRFAIRAPNAIDIEVIAQPYVTRARRTVLGEPETWVAQRNHSPTDSSFFIERDQELGRYLITVNAEGYEPLIYPIWVQREHGWIGKLSSNKELSPIPMMRLNTCPQGMAYVPKGWFFAGGDPSVSNSVIPKRALWIDGFLMAKRHVTHREYLAFLQALCDGGESERAYHLRPRLRDEEGEGLYSFAEGKVTLNESEFVRLDWPANYTDYESALAYTKWKSEETGLPYRLPSDMEWEKVARNVDARTFPWGEHFDPSFTHMRLSLPSPTPSQPDRWEADQSPWGHLALAGSMRDWTCTHFEPKFPYQAHSTVEPPSLEQQQDLTKDRIVRGGSWKTQEGNCRTAFRFVATPIYRDDDGSFRLALSLDERYF